MSYVRVRGHCATGQEHGAMGRALFKQKRGSAVGSTGRGRAGRWMTGVDLSQLRWSADRQTTFSPLPYLALVPVGLK